MLGSPVGIAAGKTMIETAMKLVDSTGQGIVPVYEIGIDDGPDGVLAPVTDLSDSDCTDPLLGNLVFLVVEPLHGLEGLINICASPATERFDRDGVGCQMVLAPIQIAGTGNGDALGHEVEASLTFKLFLKGFTTCFSQGHIGLTAVDHFLVEMKGHIATNLVIVPTGRFLFLFGHYAIRIVKFQIGNSTDVLLVVRGIEQMRKEPLL